MSIIDTPGVYDSENRDEKNFKEALETIKKNRENYQISLVLIVFKFQDMLFNKETKFMIKFFCQLFPEELAKHVCIAFTNYNKNYDSDSKYYKIKEFVPEVMKLISEYTKEPMNEEPKVIFVENRIRDWDSKTQIKEVIELAEKLPVIKKLEYSARPSSPTTHIYHYDYITKSPEIKSPEKEKEKEDDYSSSGNDGINFDGIGSLITGIKFAQNKRGGNSFLNFCEGTKLYDEIKNGNVNEKHWRNRLKSDDNDDCFIF